MKRCILAILIALLPITLSAQPDALRRSITQLVATKRATVGVGILGLETGDTLSLNSSRHFPMLSVFKFHIALAVLHDVDKGKLTLAQKIPITKNELLPNTWSPLRDDYPAGSNNLSVADVLKYTVAQSDNNGCDILLRLVGGTETVNTYIHSVGVQDVFIGANEADMHRDWSAQYTNWTTTKAAVDLLRLFYNRSLLSSASSDFLWTTMVETSTGLNRIKGQLPAGTKVAHKTGLSDTNKQGLTAAVNDVGIVTLPNGNHFAISVFVSDSMENEATNAKIIADVSKLAWDYFTGGAK